MSNLPGGTVTFLFTDIEGSTKLAREHPEAWEVLRARHHVILQSAIQSHHGYIFQIIGDAFCVAFHTAGDALQAATKSQINLQSEDWDDAPIKVRMGIHTGKAEIQENREYHGYLAMSRVQRLMSAGHGGQVLISAATQELLLEELPEEVSLRDLGERQLKDLIRPEHIYQLVIPSLPADFPPLKTLDFYRHNLPVQLTSFIGREREMGKIKQSVLSHRLVTLTGVGGTGKTRLALQVAADTIDAFQDGVWLVELAPLSDPALLPQAVATALGLREQAGRTFVDTLKDYLFRKNLLLVMDNCEHLIEACVQLADTLLHAAPHLGILATSRESLGISGEYTHPVPSLSLPNISNPSPETLSQYESVRLFIDRALAVQPNFQVTNQNAPAVAQICARLDGIPLAIELAAARVKGLSAEQIASRLNDRFRLLTGGSRTALPRQRTLQATIDWSYNLLSEEERVLLRQLSVFAGGWTIEAAEKVCAGDVIQSVQVLDLLLHLVDKSLIIAETQGTDPRYYMLETIRQYVQEKLDEAGESNVVRDRHLEYFRAFAGQAKPHFRSTEQLVWLDRLETELDNIRAALTWSIQSGSVEVGLGMAADLGADIGSFWLYLGHVREGYEFLQQLLPKPQADNQLLARGHLVAGTLAFWLDERADIRHHIEQSEALGVQLASKSKAHLAETRNLRLITYTAWKVERDPIRVREGHDENLKVFDEEGDRWMSAHTIYFIGCALQDSGDLTGARQAYEQSLALFRECGDHIRVAQQNMSLAFIAFEEGRYSEARTRFEEVLAFYRQVRVIFAADTPLWMLGVIAIREGDYAHAKALYTECLLFDQQIGVYHQLAECLIGFAGIASAEKRFERAAQLLGAVQAEIEARTPPALESFDQVEFEWLRIMLRKELGDAEFEALVATGRAMAMEHAIEFALENDNG